MGEGRLAAYKKKAHRLRAAIVFLDESGFLMAPLLRRSWAPHGQTPVVLQRTNSHKKVSVIAGLCINPYRDRVTLYFRLHPDRNIDGKRVREFLRHLAMQIRDPIVLVWDRFAPHRSRKVRKLLESVKRIHAHFLPPYAPELNPAEGVWGYLKMNPLANSAAHQLDILSRQTYRYSRGIQRKHNLLISFIEHSHLPFEIDRTLFT